MSRYLSPLKRFETIHYKIDTLLLDYSTVDVVVAYSKVVTSFNSILLDKQFNSKQHLVCLERLAKLINSMIEEIGITFKQHDALLLDLRKIDAFIWQSLPEIEYDIHISCCALVP